MEFLYFFTVTISRYTVHLPRFMAVLFLAVAGFFSAVWFVLHSQQSLP